VIVYGFSAQKVVIFRPNQNVNTMKEIFTFLKPQPFSQIMGFSSSRFSQKVLGFKTKGHVQKFNEIQTAELKRHLTLVVELLKIEIEKL
jgi:hypothetical protein